MVARLEFGTNYIDKQGKMKNKNIQILKIIRCSFVLLITCIGVWFLTILLCAQIFRLLQIPVNMFNIIVLLFLLPGTAVFFTARYVTSTLLGSKYKNILAWISLSACALWGGVFWWMLSNIAY